MVLLLNVTSTSADTATSSLHTPTDDMQTSQTAKLNNTKWKLAPSSAFEAFGLLQTPELIDNDLSGSRLSFGYKSQTLWVSFEITHLAEQALFLHLGATFLDKATLHYYNEASELVTQTTGDHTPFLQRPVLSRGLVFRLPIADQVQTRQYLLEIETGSALVLHPRLISPAQLLLEEKNSTLLYGILFGVSLMAIMLAVISWSWTRHSAFLVAAAYCTVFAWFHFTINGFDQQYLYPNIPHLSDTMIGVSGFLSGSLLISLVVRFSNLAIYFPRIQRLLSYWSIFYLLGAAASAAGAYPKLAPLLMLSGLALMALLIVLMIFVAQHDKTVPKLLLWMIAPVCLAMLLQTLRNLGVLPFNFWTTHLWALSGFLQVAFLICVLLLFLTRSKQALEQQLALNEAKQQFYQLMAHELRTPLAVISSAIVNLQRQTSNQPDMQPRLQRLRMATARLNNLVDNALAEDRLYQLEQGIQPEEVELTAWLEEIMELCLLTDKHQLELCSTGGHRKVLIDRQWLTLAVLNLLDNAVKYSPQGGLVKLILEANEKGFSISVSDQGIGINASDAAHIFKRGYRAKHHKSFPGLGLGLYLVALVAKAHHGCVSYQSESSGSTFTIVIPQVAPV